MRHGVNKELRRNQALVPNWECFERSRCRVSLSGADVQQNQAIDGNLQV